MTKKNRLRKAWSRNEDFFICKGVYFCQGPIKYWLTPRQLSKFLMREK